MSDKPGDAILDSEERDAPKNGAERVAIVGLQLHAFRNYDDLTLRLDTRHVVLTGPNGAGKTNLLEAVSLLSPGRGLRRAPYRDLQTKDTEAGFSVHVRLQRGADQEAVTAIGTGTSGAAGSDGERSRRVRIDGAPAQADDLGDHLRLAWLLPAMDGLFTGPAGDRRRFLDRMVLAIDPGHGRRALDYEKAMRARNRLLADAVTDDGWFGALEEQLAELGTAIAAAREQLVSLLAAMIGRMDGASPFPRAAIALEPGLEVCAQAGETEERFLHRLRTDRHRDRAAGRTLSGPHRADLLVRHAPKDMEAALCSTGEQKALLIGLVLAQTRLVGEMTGTAPVLLLDEVAAHLDSGRRAALFAILDELNGQAWMTGTDRELFAALGERAQFLQVREGGAVGRDENEKGVDP